jgi:glycosyltransferase involved in cell wall biosynthesis
MQANPLVSVIISSLNRAKMLNRTIDSVLQQSYANLEVIVVDGKSNEDVIDILKAYGDAICWISESDKGQADAYNKGLALSGGEIVCFLPDDDLLLPNAIEIAVNAFSKAPDWVAMVNGDAFLVDENDQTVGYRRGDQLSVEYLINRNPCRIIQPATFLKKDAVSQVGGWDTSVRYPIDFELWLRLLDRFGSQYVQVPLCSVRIHSESQSIAHPIPMMIELDRIRRRHGGKCVTEAVYRELRSIVSCWIKQKQEYSAPIAAFDQKNDKDSKQFDGLTVSIIIASLNRAEMIGRTIDSALQQSYRNLDVIVIDGGSNDSVVQILKGYGDRIRWISEKDRGEADAYNKGLRLSRGEIVCFLPDDDLLAPNAAQMALNAFTEAPDNVAMINGDAYLIDTEDHIIGFRKGTQLSVDYLLNHNPCRVTQPAIFFKKHAIEQIDGWNPAIRFVNDYDLLIRLLEHFSASYMQIPLCSVRIHDGSLSLENCASMMVELDNLRRRYGGKLISEALYRECRTIFSCWAQAKGIL